ncbi:unnamed protein product [Rotaria sp. Silwood1]|nr:unnamed protein product [Rotaria sp. Silwood1]CAF4830359.1 unnamed protein product [Rotaria sp. Silwood1]
MDATGSMYYLLHKCKNTVDIMFERASEILKEQNIKSDLFQLQFVVYRNYNSKEDKILQSSPWKTKPDNLRAFMNTIEVEGGDAPPNTKDENSSTCFFVEQQAEIIFKQIAKQTGGRCEMLDINSSSGSQMLTDLVTEEILRNIGGSTKGNALVEAYGKRFHKAECHATPEISKCPPYEPKVEKCSLFGPEVSNCPPYVPEVSKCPPHT